MDIAYVTTYDAADIKEWSGTGHYMAQSLESQSLGVRYINVSKGDPTFHLKMKCKAKEMFYGRIAGKKYLADRMPDLLRFYARQTERDLSRYGADAVFSPGTIPIAYLECKQPIVFWTDATFTAMVDFYAGFSDLCPESIRDGDAMERSALERCKLAIYSSDWAAETAIEHYQAEPGKVKVVPFGANLESYETYEDVKKMIYSRPSDICRLLFIGVDWIRKGGAVAFEVTKELRKAGVEAELTIVGCVPEMKEPFPDFVKVAGYINKASGNGSGKISSLLAESHFLIMPSIAECFGIVFCEANSFGVPCVATAVGGIPTVIRDGLNGRTFSRNAGISDYCKYIADQFIDYDRYRELALSSYNEYCSRLNWAVAGMTVKRLMKEVL